MSVLEITSVADHDNVISNNRAVIIFFGWNGCGHCRNFEPVFRSLASQYPNIKFAHVETSNVKTVNTRQVPIFAIYQNGKGVTSVLGADKREIVKMLDSLQ